VDEEPPREPARGLDPAKEDGRETEAAGRDAYGEPDVTRDAGPEIEEREA
jgi:hypothetical protein